MKALPPDPLPASVRGTERLQLCRSKQHYASYRQRILLPKLFSPLCFLFLPYSALCTDAGLSHKCFVCPKQYFFSWNSVIFFKSSGSGWSVFMNQIILVSAVKHAASNWWCGAISTPLFLCSLIPYKTSCSYVCLPTMMQWHVKLEKVNRDYNCKNKLSDDLFTLLDRKTAAHTINIFRRWWNTYFPRWANCFTPLFSKMPDVNSFTPP